MSNNLPLIMLLPLTMLVSSCVPDVPQAINIHKDNCAHCKMTIAEEHFAAELITQKGRVYKFDDIACLIAFRKENMDKTAFYIKSPELRSPMAGNIAAFKTEAEVQEYNSQLKGEITDWNKINQ